MSDNLSIFSVHEKRRLILGYLLHRNLQTPGMSVPTEEIKEFLSRCEGAIIVGESIRMAADGLVNAGWDTVTNQFIFAPTRAGELAAQKVDGNDHPTHRD